MGDDNKLFEESASVMEESSAGEDVGENAVRREAGTVELLAGSYGEEAERRERVVTEAAKDGGDEIVGVANGEFRNCIKALESENEAETVEERGAPATGEE